jgi:hypothetical protein
VTGRSIRMTAFLRTRKFLGRFNFMPEQYSAKRGNKHYRPANMLLSAEKRLFLFFWLKSVV